MTMTLDKLYDLQTDYLKGLIQFSREQKTLWQRIPYLALRADGRGGYSDQYAYAYRYGYWKIGLSNGGYSYRVDCANGNICGWADHAPVVDDTWSGLLDVSIDELDATAIFTNLIKCADKPLSSYMRKSADELYAEQEREIEQWGIKPIFERRKAS